MGGVLAHGSPLALAPLWGQRGKRRVMVGRPGE